jgi:hypothetical protein
VWSLHGGGDPYALIELNLRKRIGFAPARHVVTSVAWVLGNCRCLAPERWVARISPRPLYFINAKDDERVPRECVELLWNAAREPKEMVWIEGRHVEPKRVEIVQELVDRVLTRMADEAR